MMMTLALIVGSVALGWWAAGRRKDRCSGYTVRDVLVIDGDTLWTDGRKIRLHGIDAPEKSQPGGLEARDYLKAMVSGQELRIERTDTDLYGRTVARVHDTQGDICKRMVASGFAIASYHDDYRREEARARKLRAGLWARGGISDPAAFRRARA